MTPIVLRIIRGDTYRARLTIRCDGEVATLVGRTLVVLVKEDESTADDDAAIILTEGDGITIEDVNLGRIVIELTPEQTELLTSVSIPVWKLRVTETEGGRVYTAAGGDVLVVDDCSTDAAGYTATLEETADTTPSSALLAEDGEELHAEDGTELLAES